MANLHGSGIDALVAVLGQLLSPAPEAREAGEASLTQAGKQPGCGMALLEISLHPSLDPGIRQLAAVLLKSHVREHWTVESSHYREPPISPEEQAAIRARLPSGLADPDRKLRTAAAVAVSTIARWDCPQAWPDLLPGLLGAIAAKRTAEEVDGTVRCLAMMMDELDENQILQMAPAMLHDLASLFGAGPQDQPVLAWRAISILRSAVSALQTMAGAAAARVMEVLPPVLGEWMPILLAVLSAPWTNPSLWAAQKEAARVVTVALSAFGRLAGPALGPAVALVWSQLAASLPEYERRVVFASESDSEGEDADGPAALEELEGDRVADLETLLAQAMEVVLSTLHLRRFRKQLAPQLLPLYAVAIGYAQAPNSQAEAWLRDLDSYVADEEADMSSLRAACEMLVDETVEELGEAGRAALGAAVAAAIDEGARAKARGDGAWWRRREAAWLLVGAVAERLTAEHGRSVSATLQPGHVLDLLMAEDLLSGAPPLLRARALWLVGRFAAAASPAQRPRLYEAAAAALAPAGAPGPVQVDACRALARLCETARRDEGLAPVLAEPLLAGLGALLGALPEDSVHLVLETLTPVLRALPEAAVAAAEPAVSPAVLAVWERHVADPLIAPDAQDTLRALAACPAALPGLRARLLPALRAALAQAPGRVDALVLDGALEMARLVLLPSDPGAAREMHAALTPLVLDLAARQEDGEVLHSACRYLTGVLQVAGAAQALAWRLDAGDWLPRLLQTAARLLDPALEERAAVGVGALLCQLIRDVPDMIAPHLPELLRALAVRLERAEMSMTIQSVLVVISLLVHTCPDDLVNCLHAIQLPGKLGDERDALTAVMRKWTQRQMEVQEPYCIKLTCTALGALLLLPSPLLDRVAVRGRRLDTESGVMTRARRAQRAEAWSEVPLRSKLVQLLIDARIESLTQDLYVEDGVPDDEWEEASSDDDDGSPADAGLLESHLRYDDDDLHGDLLGEAGDPKELERRKNDPVDAVNLASFVREALGRLSATNAQAYQAALPELTDLQRQTLQQMLME